MAGRTCSVISVPSRLTDTRASGRGEEIEFDVIEGDKGPQADRVRRTKEAIESNA